MDDANYKIVDGQKIKRKKTELEKRLTLEEAERLVASITPETHKSFWRRNRAIIVFLLNTGLRVGEFSQLKIYDVLMASGKIKGTLDVRPEIAKRKKNRLVPLNESAQAAIKELLAGRDPSFDEPLVVSPSGKPITKRAIQLIVSNAALKAGINRMIGCHTLRHTCFSRMYEITRNAKIVQMIAGHSNIALTMNLYTHATLDGLTEAMKLLDLDKLRE